MTASEPLHANVQNDWLPLRQAVLRVLKWPGRPESPTEIIQRIVENINTQHKHASLSFYGEGSDFSIFYQTPGMKRGLHASFRLEDRQLSYYRDVLNPMLAEDDIEPLEYDQNAFEFETQTLRRDLDRVLFDAVKRLVQAGDCQAFARPVQPLADFKKVNADSLEYYAIADWKLGTAVCEGGPTLCSLHLQQAGLQEPPAPAMGDLERLRKKYEAKTLVGELARYFRNKYGGARPPNVSLQTFAADFLLACPDWEPKVGKEFQLKNIRTAFKLLEDIRQAEEARGLTGLVLPNRGTVLRS